VLAGIVLLATSIAANGPDFPESAMMRYSDYPAMIACLYEHPKSPAQTNSEHIWDCADKIVKERVERERNQVKQ